MKKISDQIDDIKEEMCDTRCKWLEKANRVKARRPEEFETLSKTLREVCKSCPLNRF